MMTPGLRSELMAEREMHLLASAECAYAATAAHWGRADASRRRRAGWLNRVLRRPEAASPSPAALTAHAVTIRWAFPDDEAALARLAQLDSSGGLRAPVLLAEVDGVVSAALSLADGRVVADPFGRTGAIVELLAARAAQLRPGGDTGTSTARLTEGLVPRRAA